MRRLINGGVVLFVGLTLPVGVLSTDRVDSATTAVDDCGEQITVEPVTTPNLSMVFRPSATTASTPLLVRLAGVPAPPATTAPSAGPGRTEDPPPSVPVVEGSVTTSFDQVELLAVTTEGIATVQIHEPNTTGMESITAERTAMDQLMVLILEVSVDAATDDPTGTVELLAVSGADACRVGAVAVTRESTTSVQFGGADANGALTLQIEDEAFEINVPLIVQHLDGSLRPDPVQFVDDDSRPVALTAQVLDREGQEAGEPAWLKLTADQPVPATVRLTGVVTLRWDDDGAARLSVTIDRKPLPPRIAIEATSPVQQDSLPLAGSTEVSKVLVLRESSGIAQTIDWPTVLAATRDDADDVLDDVEVVDAVVVDEEDDSATSTQTDPSAPEATDDTEQDEGPDTTFGGDATDPPTSTLVLPAGQATPVRVTMQMPTHPGKYDVDLEFDGSATAPVGQRLEVDIRYQWIVPLLLLLLGLGVSAIGRYWFQKRRKSLTRQRDIAKAQEALMRAADRATVPTDSPEAVLISKLAGRLERLSTTTFASDDEGAQAVDLGVAHTAVFTATYLPLALAIRSSTVKDARILDELGRLGDELLQEDSGEDGATARTNLTTRVGTLRATWEARAVAEVKAAVASTRETAAEFSTTDNTTLADLTEVETLADGDPFEAARRLAATQGRMIAPLHDELLSRITQFRNSSGQPPLDAETRRFLDLSQTRADAAIVGDDSAERLRSLRSGLEYLARAKAARLRQLLDGQHDPGHKPEIDRMANDFEAAQSKIRDDPSQALHDIEMLLGEYARLITPAKPAVRPAGVGAHPPDPTRQAYMKFVSADRPGVGQSMPRSSLLARKLVQVELIVTAVAAGIAIPLGLQALYAGQATWGSALQLVTMFFFGLGAQQLVGGGFNGVMSIRDAVFGPP